LLVLMDGMLPGRHSRVRRGISWLGDLLRLGQEKQLDWFLIVHHVYRYLRFPHYRQRKNSEHKGGKAGLGLAQLSGLFTTAEVLRQDYEKVFEWVAAGYTPSLYPGKITFFWVSEEQGLSVQWREVVQAKAGEVEIYSIPGNDITSRTEYLPAFVERLRACIYKAQTPGMS
jgi:hypothetical protein